MDFDDQHEAADLDDARTVLLDSGAALLAPRPWQHGGQPPSDQDMVRFAAWTTRDPVHADVSVLQASLRLLGPARSELDQIEAAIMFAARGAGLTWLQIAKALGLSSAQAAQQRSHRVLHRTLGPAAEA